jgi:hypothetical protein
MSDKKGFGNYRTPEQEERIKQMCELRKQGWTYKNIGKKYDLSLQRVHQLITGYMSPAWHEQPEKRRAESKDPSLLLKYRIIK